MARISNKTLEAVSWMLEPLDRSDEEIGRWLVRRIEDRWDKEGIVNHLFRTAERERLRLLFLVAAVTSGTEIHYCLANSLALGGEYALAGKAWRTEVAPYVRRKYGAEKARCGMLATKLERQIENETRWYSVALEVRKRGQWASSLTIAKKVQRELGVEARMKSREAPNSKTTKKLKRQSKDSVINTIRLLLPKWELDKETYLATQVVKRPTKRRKKLRKIAR